MAFIETENFDPLYKGIGELIGLPIERIVTNAGRRGSRTYLGKVVPREVKDMVMGGEDPRPVFEMIFQIARNLGYGDPSLEAFRYEKDDDDYANILFKNPYSEPHVAGTTIGALEAFTDRDNGVEYSRVSQDTLEIRAFVEAHPEEMRERMHVEIRPPREGNVRLAACPSCGSPSVLANYAWDTVNGVVKSRATGRRMAMLGPATMDPLFDELEAELGEQVPGVVIEAERRFVRSGFYSISEIAGFEEMRRQLALRGVGEIKELKLGRRGVHLELENSVMHLLVVGLTQGLYELAFGVEGKVEWEHSDEGRLTVTVTPWK
jgi:hypothetical protein